MKSNNKIKLSRLYCHVISYIYLFQQLNHGGVIYCRAHSKQTRKLIFIMALVFKISNDDVL